MTIKRGLYKLANAATPRTTPPIPDVPSAATKAARVKNARNRKEHKMTDEVIAWSILSLDLDESADELERRYAEQTVPDNIGRPGCYVGLACTLIAEHRARRAAAAAAERERRERERAERQHAAEQEQKAEVARRAREERQRELLRNDPGLDALSLMRMADGDDGGLSAAGRRWDELRTAERNGHVGYGYMFNPQQEG